MTKTILPLFALLFVLLSYTITCVNSQLESTNHYKNVTASCTENTIEPSESPSEGGELILSLLVVLLVTITTFLIILLFFWYEMNKNRK